MKTQHARYELTMKTRRTDGARYCRSRILARLWAKLLWVRYLGQHDVQIRDTKDGQYVRE